MVAGGEGGDAGGNGGGESGGEGGGRVGGGDGMASLVMGVGDGSRIWSVEVSSS